jgi:hypothetical protein
MSMPELGGAVPYKPRDDVDIDVKVYRSFGDLARPKSSTLDQTDYKIYRKSTDSVQKYATLPRQFGRSKSSAEVSNGGTLRDYDSRKRDVPYSPDYPEIMPRRRSPPESESSYGSQRGESQRTSKRVSAASSLSSLAKGEFEWRNMRALLLNYVNVSSPRGRRVAVVPHNPKVVSST